MNQIFKYLGFLIGIILICICLSKTKKQEFQDQVYNIEFNQSYVDSDSTSLEENFPESKESILNSGYVFAIK